MKALFRAKLGYLQANDRKKLISNILKLYYWKKIFRLNV